MPKRKRDPQEQSNNFRASKVRKQDVVEKYTQSKKLLHRALKTAKGFERQKLGKRLKNAKAESKIPDIIRINREIEALKGLDLDKLTEGHLNKSLLKVRAFAESVNLPEEVKVEMLKPEGTEEEVAAVRNVISGMCNMKPVKAVIETAIGEMYIALGIPKPLKGGKQEDVKGILKKDILAKAAVPALVQKVKKLENASKAEEPAWDGFDSDGEPADISMEDAEDAEDESGSGDEDEDDEDIKYDSLDEDAISRYEALLGGSSDEESFDEAEYTKSRPSFPLKTIRRSPSPSLSLSDENPNTEPTLASDSDSDSSDLSSSIPAPKSKTTSEPKSKKAPLPPRPKGSTFLPTLMGGYWSGTDSSASEIEDLPSHEIRKNRPGQSARRAIWEKKYGTGANHIKSDQGSVADKGKDDGWDAKRGAKAERRGGRGQATGENYRAVSSSSRGRGGGSGGVVARKKDDEGVLHPSWQAAKKAKDAEKTAKFAGKKVTFD